MLRWMSPIVVIVASVIPPAFLICNLVSRRARVRPVTAATYRPYMRAAPPATVSRHQVPPLRTETWLTPSTPYSASVRSPQVAPPATMAQTITTATLKSVFRPASMMKMAAHRHSTAAPAPTSAATVVRLRPTGQPVHSMSTPSVPLAINEPRRSTTATSPVSIVNMWVVKDTPAWNAIASQNWRPEVEGIRISATCKPHRSNCLQDSLSAAPTPPLEAAGTIPTIRVAI